MLHQVRTKLDTKDVRIQDDPKAMKTLESLHMKRAGHLTFKTLTAGGL